MAKAKFVLRKGSTGKFRFNLVGTNGKVIATSEAYESKASATRGIEAVRKSAGGAEFVDETPGRAVKSSTRRATTRTAGVTKSPGRTRSSPPDVPEIGRGQVPGKDMPEPDSTSNPAGDVASASRVPGAIVRP
jgi:uncharacterized protein YegP (UPF0339 family)